MKLANLRGRAVLVLDAGLLDIAEASGGDFGPGMQAVLNDWESFVEWCQRTGHHWSAVSVADPVFDAVVPRPGSVFAVGLNYRAHAVEAGLPIPEVPLVFTKFPSCVAAPQGDIELPTDQVDWEVELALVIGREARKVGRDDAWSYVAGITAAQDFSARDVQLLGGAKPQFSLGKSFENFMPLGPVLVTTDEFDDPDAIDVSCAINGETVQDSSTSDLIFPVPAIVSYLSHIVTLRPGDVILTGTPSGVGLGMTPPRYLVDGDEVTTCVAGVGRMTHVCRTPETAFDAAALLA